MIDSGQWDLVKWSGEVALKREGLFVLYGSYQRS